MNRITCIALLACACIPEPPGPDAGILVDMGPPDAAVDAGLPEAGPVDTGPAEDTGGPAPECNQNTVIFGPDCPEEGCRYGDSCGETGCGRYLCSTEGSLECFFDEANICGGCEELDTSAGMPGDTCGAHGCGTVVCNAEMTATVCPDDHPRNVCGGCATRITANAKQCLDDSDCINTNQPCANDGDCLEGHSCAPGGSCRAPCIQDPNNPFSGRFCSPGGGLVNHHFRDRAVATPGVTLVGLLGEGVFHQVHGGVATNVPMTAHPIGDFRAEYREITGGDYRPDAAPAPLYLGPLPEAARRFL